jgi:hypothetical protein
VGCVIEIDYVTPIRAAVGDAVSTPYGNGYIEEYRLHDDTYVVLLEWGTTLQSLVSQSSGHTTTRPAASRTSSMSFSSIASAVAAAASSTAVSSSPAATPSPISTPLSSTVSSSPFTVAAAAAATIASLTGVGGGGGISTPSAPSSPGPSPTAVQTLSIPSPTTSPSPSSSLNGTVNEIVTPHAAVIANPGASTVATINHVPSDTDAGTVTAVLQPLNTVPSSVPVPPIAPSSPTPIAAQPAPSSSVPPVASTPSVATLALSTAPPAISVPSAALPTIAERFASLPRAYLNGDSIIARLDNSARTRRCIVM